MRVNNKIVLSWNLFKKIKVFLGYKSRNVVLEIYDYVVHGICKPIYKVIDTDYCFYGKNPILINNAAVKMGTEKSLIIYLEGYDHWDYIGLGGELVSGSIKSNFVMNYEIKKLSFNERLIYLERVMGEPIPKTQKKIANLLLGKIINRHIKIDRPMVIRYKKLLVSSELRMNQSHNQQEVNSIEDCLFIGSARWLSTKKDIDSIHNQSIMDLRIMEEYCEKK